jgi:EAL domain-containing protein (putative c-di-GMP-specific phosphodiesterase class I)
MAPFARAGVVSGASVPASLRWLHALRSLPRLVHGGLFEPMHQPIVDLTTGESPALEVLLRVRAGACLRISHEHWIVLAEEEGCSEPFAPTMFQAGCEPLA